MHKIWLGLILGVVSSAATFTISPDAIEMGAFFGGVEVKVRGVAQNGSNVIVTVTGDDYEQHYNTKAREGPIWLNSGRIRVSDIPSLFLRFSSRPVRQAATEDTIRKYRLDERSATARLRIEPAGNAREELFRADFIARKQDQGTYQFLNSGVVMGSVGDQGTPYTLSFTWPRRAPPATYEVRVYELRDGDVVREFSAPLKVTRVGFPAWLAQLADHNAPLYGVTAVVVGAIAGFGIDFLSMLLFGKKKRSVAH